MLRLWYLWFQHTAARRRLGINEKRGELLREFQHTAARRRLVSFNTETEKDLLVSTHSRPKAAGKAHNPTIVQWLFQHTAARRRLVSYDFCPNQILAVSTHSRPKAAGRFQRFVYRNKPVSTHSRPKAAGKMNKIVVQEDVVSTHSRPKAAGNALAGLFNR